MFPTPIPVRPGEESVWDYPRPPRLEPVAATLQVVLGGRIIAETAAGFRVLETSHPPTYYVPPGDIAEGVLGPPRRAGICEWKGRAVLFDVSVGGTSAPGAAISVPGGSVSVPGGVVSVPGGAVSVPGGAWAYPDPTPGFRAIAGYVAFYAGPMDACFVGGVRAEAQPGGFYGGWITPGIVGPFKGGPGSMGW